MGVQEVPRSFVYICDSCGEKHTQRAEGFGHYTNSRPPRWAWLTVERSAADYQGAQVADASIKSLLCEPCARRVVSAINRSVKIDG